MNQDHKRLSINMIAQVTTFTVQIIISFLLTPFIVKKLGADAYGYIGLADSFVMYAQIVVIALNSMAGRYVTIAYHQHKILDAKKLFSAVFFANVFISFFIFFACVGCVWWLEFMIQIPNHLMVDVKCLFSLIFLNFIISVIFSTFQVATFIKNRLELNAIRSVVSNILRVGILLVAFGLFIPHLWYMGLASIAGSMYIAITNIRYTKRLTPELIVSFAFFDFEKIKVLVKAGIWNSITKLGNLLGQGLDLLFANLFIDAMAMGYLSITKKIPVVILGLVASICAAFAPSMTKSFADGDMEKLKQELIFSIRFSGFICLFPTCFVFALGDSFYALWLHGENAKELYVLTILGTICNPIAMSLEGVQNIFTITNKVKVYSLVALGVNLGTFLTLFLGIRFIPVNYRIFFLASVHSGWAFFRVALFMPIYAAHCIHEKKTFFYPAMLKVIVTLVISISIMYAYKICANINGWGDLAVSSIILLFVCFVLGLLIIFPRQDRQKVLNQILAKVRK